MINQKSVKIELLNLINEIEGINSIIDIPKLKKLKGHKAANRIRIGDYRIGFFYQSETIIFARIIHRKDIYKIFP